MSSETPHTWKNAPFTQPMLLPVCCLCGLVRDAGGSSPGLERWLPLRTYEDTYDMKRDDLTFTHTYCPSCLKKVRETTVQTFQQIGTAQ